LKGLSQYNGECTPLFLNLFPPIYTSKNREIYGELILFLSSHVIFFIEINGRSPLGVIAHIIDISPIASEETSATENAVYFLSILI